MVEQDNRGSAGGIVASSARLPLEEASFLRAVLEAIPAFVVRLDSNRRINYINRLRAGLSLDQVVGQPVREFIAQEDFARFEHAIEHALRTGTPATYLVKGSRPVTGRGAAHYEGHAVPVDDGNGRRGVCIIALDVSEHVARAERLQQSEEKLRVALEASGLGLWTWDIASDVVEYDERLLEVMGCKPSSARDYVGRLVHPDDRERMMKGVDAISAGRPNFFDHRIVRPDGEIRWLLPSGRVSRDESGRVVRMLGGLLDVTAGHKMEEHLRSAQKLDALGSLTAGVAHNFNNMLGVILPALELSMRGAAPAQAGVLEDALHAARRAAELVAQLMTFAGRRDTRTHLPHDLVPVLERVVSLCRRTFERQVLLETSFDPSCSVVACDPTAIEQVVVNLVINARDAVIQAARAEPRVGVTLSEVDTARPGVPDRDVERFACISVDDNGIGMSDAVKQRLFEPFFSTKGPGKGTGLGLATSYGIVRDHGGFIQLDSQPEIGTRAQVFLPLGSPRAAAAPKPPDPPVQSAQRQAAILVVDDEPALRRMMDLLLRERGHRVQLAEHGSDAVAALDAGLRPDLILLDRSMPGWTVQRTLDEIRKRTANVPVLFLTGQDVPADERAQVQDVLHKPLSIEELLRAVDRWLGSARAP